MEGYRNANVAYALLFKFEIADVRDEAVDSLGSVAGCPRLDSAALQKLLQGFYVFVEG